MTKEEKRCKECEGKGDDCKCPDKSKKGKIGWYGLDREHNSDDDFTVDGHMVGGEGDMSESLAQQQTRKAAAETRSLAKFKQKAKEAKERQEAKKDLHNKMKVDLRNKGVRFYDSKGSGWVKSGKKEYD